MLTFSQVSKSFEGRQVLRDVTLSVVERSRTAVVGVNGSWKSTLLRLAAGLIAPDVGSVRTAPGTAIAYVPQDYLPVGDQTVEAYLRQRAGVLELEQRLRRLERALARGAPDAVDATDRYTALGGYELPGRIERALAVLKLPPSLLGRPVAELSGGQQVRV
ncbi:MAG: ATP-binding cassette domain-containing protein, partial [Pseudonocardiaceae bacterium]